MDVIPLMRLTTRESDFECVRRVLESGQLIQGPVVHELESRLKELVGVKHGIAVSSGTAALHLALLALGVGAGDEVVVPAFSFVATANAVELCGARTKFVDISLDDFNMDPERLVAAITPRTRVIMPVHEFGAPAPIEAISAIARDHGVEVVEDAACALGARHAGAHCGAQTRASTFSFHPRKIVTSGEGGFIATNDPRVAEFCESMRNHGLDQHDLLRSYKAPGFNYRLSDIHAALLLGQLERLNANLERRREIAERYAKEIATSAVQVPSQRPGTQPTWQTYFVMLARQQDRHAFIAHLMAYGVHAGAGAQCIPAEPFYQLVRGEEPINYPAAHAAYTRGVAIPLYDSLTDAEVSRVIEAVNSFGEGHA